MKKQVAVMLLMSMAVLFSACAKKDNSLKEKDTTTNTVAIADVIKDVEAAYGDEYVATNILDDETIKELIGIDADWCNELYAANSLVGTHKDILIAVKAKPEYLEKVLLAINEYRDKLIDETVQYPLNMQKIQASRIDTYGNYVFFTLLGFIPSEVEEKSDDEILAAYQEENLKAVDVYESYFIE